MLTLCRVWPWTASTLDFYNNILHVTTICLGALFLGLLGFPLFLPLSLGQNINSTSNFTLESELLLGWKKIENSSWACAYGAISCECDGSIAHGPKSEADCSFNFGCSPLFTQCRAVRPTGTQVAAPALAFALNVRILSHHHGNINPQELWPLAGFRLPV